MNAKPLTATPSVSATQLPPRPADLPEARVVGHDGKDARTEIPREKLDDVVAKMNEAVQIYSYNLKFEVVDKNRVVISIINSETGEVLKQIPPEDLIKTFERMDECLGVLVDRKV